MSRGGRNQLVMPLGRLVALPWLLVPLACGGDATPKSRDAAAPEPSSECSDERPCEDGFVCALARCYRACADDDACSARESCVTSGPMAGLCLGSDAAVPVGPCDSKLCSGETPVCHASGLCVECTSEVHCAGERPVCDLGTGRCAARAPELCAPCNASRDCAADDAGSGLDCVALAAGAERVCLPQCGEEGDCADGFTCLPEAKVCAPRRGSCTSFRAAQRAQPCDAAVECSAVGLTENSPQAGACHEGHCAFPCAESSDCPDAGMCAAPVCVAPTPDAGAPPAADGGV